MRAGTLGACVIASIGSARAEGAPTAAPVASQQAEAAEAAATAEAAPAADAAETASTSGSSGPRLRGDGRVLGFVSTPFGGNPDGTGVGFGIAANIGWDNIPVSFGFDVMTAFLGDASSEGNLQTGNAITTVQRDRSDKVYYLDLSLRVQPLTWWARPYLEGVVGTKMLETKYSLFFPASGTSTSAITDHDWASSIGWGAGLDLGDVGSRMFFTVGVRRLNGANASFSRAIDVGGGTVIRYDSPTSTTFWMLGLAGAFGGQGASP